MTTSDFTTAISVDQSPAEVFQAINNVKGWWSEQVEGGTEQLNDEFKYHFQDVHLCRMRLTEVIPNRKVVWLVLDNYFKFAQDQTEWINTAVSFDISEKEGKTQLVFRHHGLLPEHECYEICSNAWTGYLQKSLFSLITTGQGQPNGKDKPQTEDEKRLGQLNQDA